MMIVDRTAATSAYDVNLNGFPILSRFGSVRSLAGVDGIMLHQMGFDRGEDLDQYNRTIAHFIVTRGGVVAQTRALPAQLNCARARRSVQIEFVGDYPGSTRFEGHGSQTPTLAQIRAGRWLVREICEGMGLSIRYLVAHRQWNPVGRPRDPGPHIWYNVAGWAHDTLGLSHDPPGAESGDIPIAWNSARFDVDANRFGNGGGWMSFVRRESRAIGSKIFAGGVIGIYSNPHDAETERAVDRIWAKPDGTWECWLRQTSFAEETEAMQGGVVAFFNNSTDALREADPDWPEVRAMTEVRP